MVCVGNCGHGCHNFTSSVIQLWSHLSLYPSSHLFGSKKNPNNIACKILSELFLYNIAPEIPFNKTEEGKSKSDPSRRSVRTPCCSTEKGTNLILTVLQAVCKRHAALRLPIAVFRCALTRCGCCVNRLVNGRISVSPFASARGRQPQGRRSSS